MSIIIPHVVPQPLKDSGTLLKTAEESVGADDVGLKIHQAYFVPEKKGTFPLRTALFTGCDQAIVADDVRINLPPRQLFKETWVCVFRNVFLTRKNVEAFGLMIRGFVFWHYSAGRKSNLCSCN